MSDMLPFMQLFAILHILSSLVQFILASVGLDTQVVPTDSWVTQFIALGLFTSVCEFMLIILEWWYFGYYLKNRSGDRDGWVLKTIVIVAFAAITFLAWMTFGMWIVLVRVTSDGLIFWTTVLMGCSRVFDTACVTIGHAWAVQRSLSKNVYKRTTMASFSSTGLVV